ncbi:MAG: hypothetical protein GY806_13465 [Gammaproteobacteria bacterium]|nr:hypothetical protein [Gammaproteobacteria bacterium]
MFLISLTIISGGANATEISPAPGLLELLGQTLELEQLGVDVDLLIDQRLQAQKQHKKVPEKVEESNL